MLNQRYKYDGKETIVLTKLQINTRNEVIAKIESQNYLLEEIKCVCGNKNFEVLAEKDRYGLPVRNVICINCGLVFINPRMTQNAYNDFYQLEYRKLYNGIEVVTSDYYNSRVAHGERIYEFISMRGGIKRGKVLEIGCGSGGNLEHFKNNGWDVTGIDLGAEYLDYGKKRGLNLLWGHSKELLKTHEEKFDLIILSHVIEHFLDLNYELTIAYRLLKKEGLLYIETPGIKNLENSYNSDFLRYLQNAHTYSFTLNTLSQILNLNGFSLIKGDEYIHSLYKKEKERDVIYGPINFYEDVKSYLINLESNIRYYQHKRTNKINTIRKKRFVELKLQIQKYPNKSIVLYGIGSHTRMLLSFLGEDQRIFGLTDNDPEKYGQIYLGYQIFDLNKIIDHIKAVVISSDVYQEIIYKRIHSFLNSKIDIIKIYQDYDLNEEDIYYGKCN